MKTLKRIAALVAAAGLLLPAAARAGVSVYTESDIARTGARTLDEALAALAAVDVAKSGALGAFATLKLRGTPSPAQVLVDGRPAGGTSLQYIDVSQVPADRVERIEVVRGASPLDGPNALGGVVRVFTKRHPGGRARSSVGMHHGPYQARAYGADVGGEGRGFDGYANAGRYYSDGYQQNGDAHNMHAFGAGGYSFANGARVSLDVGHSNHDIGDPRGTSVPLDMWDGTVERTPTDPARRVEQDSMDGRLLLRLPLGDAVSLQSVFYGSDLDRRELPAKGAPPAADRNDRVAGNDTRLEFGNGLMIGGSYQRDRQQAAGAGADHVVGWAAYVRHALSFGPVDLAPAARLDRHGDFGGVASPEVEAALRLGAAWTVATRAARAFRAPTFQELAANAGLRPETAWNYDLSVERRIDEGRRAVLTGFHTRARELIVGAANGPRAEISGVEFESAARHGPVTESVAYTYQRARGSGAASSEFVELRLTPRHLANWRLDWRLPRGFTLSNAVRYVHSRHQSDGRTGLKLPSYTIWNVRLTKQILGAELYAAADNVTDKRYAEAFGVHPVSGSATLLPLPGRSYWGGLQIRFLD